MLGARGRSELSMEGGRDGLLDEVRFSLADVRLSAMLVIAAPEVLVLVCGSLLLTLVVRARPRCADGP